MKKAALLIAFVSISLISSAQRKEITDDDIKKAGMNMQKFAKQQSTATAFYIIGSTMTLIGAYSITSSVSDGSNGLLIIGPLATGVGWIIDRSSYKFLEKSGMYLSGSKDGIGLSLNYRF